MKHLYTLILIIAASMTAQAQWGFGLKAGGGIASLHTTYGEDKFFRATPGWQAGVFTNHALNDQFSVQGSLTYITKGYRDFVRSTVVKYNDYYRVNYIEFTPQTFFTTRKFLAGVGPYLSYGLGGRWRQKGLVAGIGDTNGKLIFVNDLKNSGTDITVGTYGKKTDVGATVSLGYKLRKDLSVLLMGSRSLVNIAPPDYGNKPNYVDHNYTVHLGLQYQLW